MKNKALIAITLLTLTQISSKDATRAWRRGAECANRMERVNSMEIIQVQET